MQPTQSPLDAQPPRRRSRWLLITLAFVITAGLLGRGWLTAVVQSVTSPRLQIVDATRTQVDESTIEFQWPESSTPSIVRLGSVGTPIGASSAVESDRWVIVPLYEDLGPLTLAIIEKSTGRQCDVTIDGAKFAYGLCFDRQQPDTLWVGTSEQAQLLRVDLQTGGMLRVVDLADDSHIFALAQSDDGTVYLGTYPTRRCFRVQPASVGWSCEPLAIDHPAIAKATYQYRIAATNDTLLLSYSAPAVLLRHDLKTHESRILIESPLSFLELQPIGDQHWVSDGTRWHGFNDRLDALPADTLLPPYYPPQVVARGQHADLIYRGGRAKLSLAPRSGGMGITALDTADNGRIYGATYWNTWLFEVDSSARRIIARGALPGGSGEFFHSASRGGRLVIPSYQGVRYEYDPAREWQATTSPTNPQIVARLDQTHYGTASATLTDGRFVYATFPNYQQRSGRLVFCESQGDRVIERIGDDLTLGHLATSGDRLFGGTLRATGSGLADSNSSARPKLVELDDRGQIIQSLPLDDREDDVTGLLALDASRLLIATKRRLLIVDVSSSTWHHHELPLVNHLKHLFDGHVRRLVRHDQGVLILTASHLLQLDAASETLRILARMPVDCHLAAITDGKLYLANRESLWCVELDE